MIRPRVQKALSDVLGNPSRSLLVTASIMVGLFAVGIIFTLYMNLLDDMRAGYAAANPANIMVTTGFFDDGLVKHVSRLEGVRQAEGVMQTSARAQFGDSEWVTISLMAARDFDALVMNHVVVRSGRWSPGKDEIVFDQNKLYELGAEVGDVIRMEVSPGKIRLFTVVGIIQDQTIGAYSMGGGYFMASLQGYVDADSLAYLNLPDTYNTLYVTAEQGEDEAAITRLVGLVRDAIEDNRLSIYNIHWRLSNDHPNMVYVNGLVGVLFLLGFLVVFLSGFLITNMLSALLKQQTAQIGIMKTIGGRTYQIISMYMTVIFLYSLVAFALAVPTSYLVSQRLMEFLSSMINIVVQSERLHPEVIALQAAIALIVPQVAGFLPIYRGARMPVQAALSGIETQAGHAAMRRTRLHGLRGLPRPLLISLRNVFRRKSRLVLTLITLSLGGAVFIATFNVRSSLEVYVDQLMRYFRSDVNITLERDYRIEQVLPTLLAMPEIQHAEPWLAARAEMMTSDDSVGENFSILGPPSDSTLVVPMLVSGRWIVPGDENAITLSENFMSRFPDIQVGDTLQIEVNGEESEWVVVGFFQLAGKSGGLIAYTSYDALAEVTGRINYSNAYRILSTGDGLTLEEQELLGRRIEAHLLEKGIHLSEVTAGASINTSTARGLDVLTTFLLIMAGLTALVGSIGLTGTMSLNVLERTREIGVMRAIGASDGSLFRLVIVEGTIIGLISWLVGVALSFPISRAISTTINTAVFDAPSSFTWTVDGFVIWLGIVLVLAVVASSIPARSATHLTIREVLAYE